MIEEIGISIQYWDDDDEEEEEEDADDVTYFCFIDR
jgi:hypothetical protein